MRSSVRIPTPKNFLRTEVKFACKVKRLAAYFLSELRMTANLWALQKDEGAVILQIPPYTDIDVLEKVYKLFTRKGWILVPGFDLANRLSQEALDSEIVKNWITFSKG